MYIYVDTFGSVKHLETAYGEGLYIIPSSLSLERGSSLSPSDQALDFP